MANKSKAKGNRFEKECCSVAEKYGFAAKRAWGSDGRSIGKSPEVDIVLKFNKLKELDIQCKVRKTIAEYIIPPKDCDFTLIKQDRGEIYACIKYEELLKLFLETFKKEEKVGNTEDIL
jgi:Holliday junction resolvase